MTNEHPILCFHLCFTVSFLRRGYTEEVRKLLHTAFHGWVRHWLKDSKDRADAEELLAAERSLYEDGPKELCQEKANLFSAVKVQSRAVHLFSC